MSLIDRYVYAVTKRMHPDVKDDVAKELRATIEDELEAKGSRSKKHINEVLTELGDPSVLARQYKTPVNYLIGPDFFYPFLRTLKLVLSISLPIVFIVSIVSAFINEPGTLINLIGYAVGNTVFAAGHILFWVTLVFFIMERSGVKSRDIEKSIGPWTPAQLPAESKKRQIPLSESVTGLVSYILLLIAPFVAPYVAAVYSTGSKVEFFATDLWQNWTFVIVAVALAGILVSIGKIVTKKWTTALVIANVAFSLGAAAVLIAVLLTTQVVSDGFAQLALEHTEGATPEKIGDWITWGVAITFIVTIGIYLYDAGQSIWLRLKK